MLKYFHIKIIKYFDLNLIKSVRLGGRAILMLNLLILKNCIWTSLVFCDLL